MKSQTILFTNFVMRRNEFAFIEFFNVILSRKCRMFSFYFPFDGKQTTGDLFK